MICALWAVVVSRCMPQVQEQSSFVKFVIMSCIIQQLRERSGNGLSMEKLRINVDDRVLVDEGKYSGHYGIVSQLNSDERTVLVQLERFPETSIQISFGCLRDKGWKDVDYPVSRANDPVDW